MISSELPEIVKVCDRTYVMREGRIAGELQRHAMSEEAILTLGMHHA
jgi:ribose transport system ATP-binding protein